MKIKDILSWDATTFLSMDRRSLAQSVSLLSRAANKRVQRLEKEDVTSPALRNLQSTGSTRFSTKGKSLNELRTEYTRAKRFLESKTSTLRGFREVEERTYKRMGYTTPPDIDTRNAIWEVYTQLENTDSTLLKNYGSERAQKLIAANMREGSNIGETLAAVKDELRQFYEEQEMSDFGQEDVFELGGYNPFDGF